MPHECTTCGQQFDDGSKEMLSGCPNCGGNKFQFKPPNRDSEPDEPASMGESGEPASTADSDAPEGEPTSTAEQSDAVSTTEPAAAASPTEPAESLSDPGSGGEIDLPDDTAHAADAAGEEAADAVDADTTATAGADEALRDAEEFRDAEIADETGAENSAQRDARSAAASPDEIDDARRQVSDAESQASREEASRGRGTPQGPPAETPSGSDPDEFDLSGALGPDDPEPVEKQPVAGSAPEREEPVTDEDTDLRALREELNQQFESIKITAPASTNSTSWSCTTGRSTSSRSRRTAGT
ncbi:hypothetical protein SY89_00516 [Halolamina pelagica]|uniref:Uncharacterized protein n=1 Tax=Halolamina pelagica TaxID=699431 RepID=A0A0P7GMK2_9EURY|nr:Zn-ribbon containing protein [Halolamina pelagica]KPN29798.1 hypothetical protein SY89_00516 [Halolamina pelagica]